MNARGFGCSARAGSAERLVASPKGVLMGELVALGFIATSLEISEMSSLWLEVLGAVAGTGARAEVGA